MADCYEFGSEAFDLAERLQTPVFVLSDLDLGMNLWMSDPFAYPDKPWDRGKVLGDEDLAKLEKFERYRDVDGDGIPLPDAARHQGPARARTSPAARATTRRRATRRAPRPTRANLDRLERKFDTARTLVPAPEVETAVAPRSAIIAYGSTHWALSRRATMLRRTGTGIETTCASRRCRSRGASRRSSSAHDRVYVVEQNRDGQMARCSGSSAPDARRRGCARCVHYDGLPVDAPVSDRRRRPGRHAGRTARGGE